MRRIGFSTGALAKGDFREGIRLQQSIAQIDALELSALRESELDPLIDAIPTLELERFSYVSFHAPSRLLKLSEQDLVRRLQTLTKTFDTIVVHPDIITDFSVWEEIQSSIALENMDQRKSAARTAADMKVYFDALPEARFCFDIGHARQVDPTQKVARDLLHAYSDRLVELHVSEVNRSNAHVPISSQALNDFRQISSLIPRDIPAIIESIVSPDMIPHEIEIVRESLADQVAV